MQGENVIASLVDRKKIAERLALKQDLLFQKIKINTYYAIKHLEPSEVLSFYLTNNSIVIKTMPLDASLEYCKVLFSFLRGNSFNGKQIESFVTPKALEAVEKSIVEFYSDDRVIQEFASGLGDELGGDSLIGKVLRGEIQKDVDWLKGETLALIRNNFGGTLSTEMAQNLVHSVHVFAESAAGKTLISTTSKVLATGAGKMLVAKLAVVISHTVASSAFHAAIVAGVKKVGVTVIVKTAIGKAIIALLALLGITATIPLAYIILPIITATIPLAYIILPIIGIVIAYEYNKLPEKLADKVPDEVVSSLRPKFTELNETITSSLLDGVLSNISS